MEDITSIPEMEQLLLSEQPVVIFKCSGCPESYRVQEQIESGEAHWNFKVHRVAYDYYRRQLWDYLRYRFKEVEHSSPQVLVVVKGRCESYADIGAIRARGWLTELSQALCAGKIPPMGVLRDHHHILY